ncbi:alpha/beta fold hydrolase [Erythrobacter sp. SDW2]|uniref:alpha/beta fold hydrolase BchO n=1 Tax=Erythrobacter sp. SDW2 TaxID=2907154 RepID=UPI001F3DB5A9|nr:alpha/beta fold hydrolase BchO [Erythrobacter sp. SDW2]UIP06913.1 alpha/beta fold hydrolase [Erythrobacter sp. SDW2]
MTDRYPDWNRDGADWPNREHSRFIVNGGYRWHVQRMGPQGAPRCLLLHGTGAATHSWRDLVPLLAAGFEVLAMDLPGHGFTRSNFAKPVTLPGMAASVEALLEQEDFVPELIVGHSAGAAIGIQMLLASGRKVPLVGLNPALLPFPGLAAKLFPSLAQLLFANPLVSVIVARMMRAPTEPERFLKRATGSRLDAAGLRAYRALLTKSGHCDGAIRMMANWRLEDLQATLPRFAAPVLLVHASGDTAIPATAVQGAADLIPRARLVTMPGVGHLAHEERPRETSELISDFFDEVQ